MHSAVKKRIVLLLSPETDPRGRTMESPRGGFCARVLGWKRTLHSSLHEYHQPVLPGQNRHRYRRQPRPRPQHRAQSRPPRRPLDLHLQLRPRRSRQSRGRRPRSGSPGGCVATRRGQRRRLRRLCDGSAVRTRRTRGRALRLPRQQRRHLAPRRLCQDHRGGTGRSVQRPLQRRVLPDAKAPAPDQ